MTGTGQDDVDRALAAVGAKSFVYRSFRRQPRPAEVVVVAPEPEPEPVAAEPAPAELPEDIAESAIAEPVLAQPVLAEPSTPAIMPAEESMPTQTAPVRGDNPAQALTFEAAAPVFATAPPAPPPPPPNSATPEPAAPAVLEQRTRHVAPSEDLDHQSVAAMFRLLTGRAEPPRRTEARRRVEPSHDPAPPLEPPAPTPPRPEPAPLGFGLASHLSSRIGGPEPRLGSRDVRPEPRPEPRPELRPELRPERRPPADPPSATRPAIPSTDPPVDQGLFRRL